MSRFCALCHSITDEAYDQHFCPAVEIPCGRCGRDIGNDEECSNVGGVFYHEGCAPEPEEGLLFPMLARCPFCGQDAFVEREMICVYAVRCNGCGARGPSVEEMRFEWSEVAGQYCAAVEWNKRVSISSDTTPVSQDQETPQS